jgi:hypothetical protein
MMKKRILISVYQPIVIRNLSLLGLFDQAGSGDIDLFLVTSPEIADLLKPLSLLPDHQIKEIPAIKKYSLLRGILFVRKRIDALSYSLAGNFGIVARFFRFAFRLLKHFYIGLENFYTQIAYKNVENLFGQLDIDTYLSTIPTNSDEAHIFYTAKAMQVRCVCLIKALDNLTTSRFLIGHFDSYCVWNFWHRDTLVNKFGVPERAVCVTGAPQPIEIKRICEAIELNGAKRSSDDSTDVLYCCSPENIFSGDVEIISRLLDDFPNAKFIVRLHPADTDYSRFDCLEADPRIQLHEYVSGIRGASFLGSAHVEQFAEQLYASSVVVCLGSTVILDAMAAGTVPISIRFSLSSSRDKIEPNFWYSQEHLRFLCEQLSFPIADSYEELSDCIEKFGGRLSTTRLLSDNKKALDSLIEHSSSDEFFKALRI